MVARVSVEGETQDEVHKSNWLVNVLGLELAKGNYCQDESQDEPMKRRPLA